MAHVVEFWGVWRSNEDGRKTSFVGAYSTEEKATVVANAPGVKGWGPGKVEPIPALSVDGQFYWLEHTTPIVPDQDFDTHSEEAKKLALSKLSPGDRIILGL